jgi:hypothetical protein
MPCQDVTTGFGGFSGDACAALDGKAALKERAISDRISHRRGASRSYQLEEHS